MDSLLLTVTTVLVAIIGYFVKKTLDKTEAIGADVADMRPKVDILWKIVVELGKSKHSASSNS